LVLLRRIERPTY